VSYEEILKKYWGYDGFRGIQREIIESIGSGKDTLGLMPTGGGKSITFQVPALACEGVCLVITPLTALMKDQVMNLRKRGIKAASIHSGMTHDKVIATLENCVFGAVKILYVSPERLGSKLFMAKLRHMKVSFVTVDEAHCISQWGYDFRPSYLRIADVRHELLGVPVLALTATATPSVVDDIQDKLGFKEKNVFRMSFERTNLAYVVRKVEDKESEIINILEHTEGSAIVYVRRRDATELISDHLRQAGFTSTAYHARLDDNVKDERQKAWQADRVRVMVATNAFGMGIDKPDVRIVIHYDCPESIEEYFQEAGRAGRDGKKSYAVMLADQYVNESIVQKLRMSYPSKDYARQVYDQLAYYFQIGVDSGYNAMFEFDIEDFGRRFHHYPNTLEPALHLLTLAGYIDYSGETEIQTRVQFVVERDELYSKRTITPDEDTLIECLLRTYTGLFADLVSIGEDFLAMKLGVNRKEVSKLLLSLSRKRIIRYIPHKTAAYIHYPQRREDSCYLQFPPAIYEERRERAIVRAKAMLGYLTDENTCRSVFLLRYFGEEIDHPCHKCDICCQQSKEERKAEYEKARQAIIEYLSKCDKCLADDMIVHLPYTNSYISEVVRDLLVRGEIACKDGFISLSPRKL